MAKKVDIKNSTEKTEAVHDNVIVFVNVVKNFLDSTDNNRTISAGPNTYYRTNKDRADKLVEAGFCKYDDVELKVVEDSINTNDVSINAEKDKTPNLEKANASDDSNPNE